VGGKKNHEFFSTGARLDLGNTLHIARNCIMAFDGAGY
jgi:hypothetical protein